MPEVKVTVARTYLIDLQKAGPDPGRLEWLAR